MIKIAITGPIASGKSLVEKFFQREGAVTLDTDKVAHEILAGNSDIMKKFGTTDRKKLAEIVFSDKQKLKQLENIIHPEVKKEVEKFFTDNKEEEMVAVSVPLLYEAGMEGMFDFVITVTSSEKLQIERLTRDRGLSKDEALKRIRARDFKPKGDFIIENNDTIDNLQKKVKNIIRQIKDKSGDFSNR